MVIQGGNMKDLKKAFAAIVVLGLCLGVGHLTGLSFSEFIVNVEINLKSLVKVLAIISGLIAVNYLLKMILDLFRKRNTVLTILYSLLDYITATLCVVWSLRILGADINGIIAGIGILGLIIGMSAQDIINDLVTGVFLLLEQEYKVGDTIEVDGVSGKVTEIGIRTTGITDNGGNEKIINNSAMTNILNKSSYRSVAVVDISLPADTEVNKVTGADYGDIKCLGLEEIGDELTFRFIKECDENEIYEVRRKMNVELLEKFRELELM